MSLSYPTCWACVIHISRVFSRRSGLRISSEDVARQAWYQTLRTLHRPAERLSIQAVRYRTYALSRLIWVCTCLRRASR